VAGVLSAMRKLGWRIDRFRIARENALNRGPATTDTASNSDKSTSQHSLDENRVYSVLLLPATPEQRFQALLRFTSEV